MKIKGYPIGPVDVNATDPTETTPSPTIVPDHATNFNTNRALIIPVTDPFLPSSMTSLDVSAHQARSLGDPIFLRSPDHPIYRISRMDSPVSDPSHPNLAWVSAILAPAAFGCYSACLRASVVGFGFSFSISRLPNYSFTKSDRGYPPSLSHLIPVIPIWRRVQPFPPQLALAVLRVSVPPWWVAFRGCRAITSISAISNRYHDYRRESNDLKFRSKSVVGLELLRLCVFPQHESIGWVLLKRFQKGSRQLLLIYQAK